MSEEEDVVDFQASLATSAELREGFAQACLHLDEPVDIQGPRCSVGDDRVGSIEGDPAANSSVHLLELKSWSSDGLNGLPAIHEFLKTGVVDFGVRTPEIDLACQSPPGERAHVLDPSYSRGQRQPIASRWSVRTCPVRVELMHPFQIGLPEGLVKVGSFRTGIPCSSTDQLVPVVGCSR